MSDSNDIHKSIHTPVLLQESIDGLNIREGDIYLDGTLGSAGHVKYALKKTHGNLTIIGLDRDIEAINRSRKILSGSFIKGKIFLKQASYGDLDKVLEELGIKKVNRIIFDLGLSSDQFETSRRGFTFKKDEPLLMTFSKDIKPDDLTAKYILNNWEESSIRDIIHGYGEERYFGRIAQGIVEYRLKKKIETTFELVEIINQSIPMSYRRGRIHPATRTFQALRIAVNDELNTLKDGLKKGFESLDTNGRMAVISFHSLEDRIVKHFFREKYEEAIREDTKEMMYKVNIITKKPTEALKEEVESNPRARSAKLRIIEKTNK